MATKSSPEHIAACLLDLRRIFGITQKMTTEQMTWQTALYVEALQDLSPGVLSTACKQIVRENDRFPTPSVIRKAAKAIGERHWASHALANPDPNAPENFLARVKRVSTHDASWLRQHHYLLEQAIAEHMDGQLDDDTLRTALGHAERGESTNWQVRAAE